MNRLRAIDALAIVIASWVSDEAIQSALSLPFWIASLRSQ
jgi:DMSO reductase anchor subunit